MEKCQLSCQYCTASSPLPSPSPGPPPSPSPPPPPGSPPPPSPPACVDKDADFCESKASTLIDKIMNCKTRDLMEKCQLSCQYCTASSPLPSPSPSPLLSPGSLQLPSPPACVDKDAEFCESEVITLDDKINKCQTDSFMVACQLSCGHCTMSP